MRQTVAQCLLIALILMLAIPVSAGQPGESAGQFLMIGPGSRAAAMGGAYTAVANGADALYWNPAGLARTRLNEIAFVHTRWFQDIVYNNLAYADGHQVFDGHLGAGITYLDYGEIDITRISGQNPVTGFGTTDASDFALAIGYGQQWYRFDWGANVKYIKETIAGKSDFSMAFDLGLMARDIPAKNVTVGVALLNLGSRLQLQEEKYWLPLTLKLGMAYQCQSWPLLVSIDASVPNDDSGEAAFGMEWSPVDLFKLRVGYMTENDAGPGVTAGIGLTPSPELSIDYAFVPYGDLGDAHRFSINYKFGPSYEMEQEYDEYWDDMRFYRNQPRADTPPVAAAPPAASTPARETRRAPGRSGAYEIEYVRPASSAAAPPADNASAPPPGPPAQELFNRGWNYYERGMYQRSIEYYHKALAVAPDDAVINYNLAVSYYTIGEYAPAGQAFQRAAQLNPRDSMALLYLGICYERQGDIESAVRAWETAHRIAPDNQAISQLIAQYRR